MPLLNAMYFGGIIFQSSAGGIMNGKESAYSHSKSKLFIMALMLSLLLLLSACDGGGNTSTVVQPPSVDDPASS